jgi:peptidylprolyl isomerase
MQEPKECSGTSESQPNQAPQNGIRAASATGLKKMEERGNEDPFASIDDVDEEAELEEDEAIERIRREMAKGPVMPSISLVRSERGQQEEEEEEEEEACVEEETESNHPKMDLSSLGRYRERLQSGELVLEDVTPTKDGGVRKAILRRGSGRKPTQGCKVTIHFVGRLHATGQIFDWSASRRGTRKKTFQLGKGAVLPGLELGALSMMKGERAVVVCSPAYAYGPLGCPDRIPPDSYIEFKIELLYFAWPAAKQGEKPKEPVSVRLEKALREREAGNDQYKRKAFAKARSCYNKGLAAFDGAHHLTEEEEREVGLARVHLHTNLAMCFLNQSAPNVPEAIKHCKQALEIDPDYKKALFHLARGYELQHDYDRARETLCHLKTLGLDPVDLRKIEAAFLRIARAEKVADKKSFFRGMFQKKNDSNNSHNSDDNDNNNTKDSNHNITNNDRKEMVEKDNNLNNNNES